MPAVVCACSPPTKLLSESWEEQVYCLLSEADDKVLAARVMALKSGSCKQGTGHLSLTLFSSSQMRSAVARSSQYLAAQLNRCPGATGPLLLVPALSLPGCKGNFADQRRTAEVQTSAQWRAGKGSEESFTPSSCLEQHRKDPL